MRYAAYLLQNDDSYQDLELTIDADSPREAAQHVFDEFGAADIHPDEQFPQLIVVPDEHVHVFTRGNHSGTDLLDREWRAADAAVYVLADRTIELNGDGFGAAPDHCGWQAVEVAGADIVADADPVPDAEAGQGVGKAGSLDGLDAVADGVVEQVQLAVELTGSDQGDQGLDGVGRKSGMAVGCGVSWT